MNSITAISEKLHQARIERGLSLDDIASATRINLKFLQEIDEGILPAVGPTYIRAFLKAFAAQVGLDPVELLKEVPRVPETPAAPAPPGPAEPERTATANATGVTPPPAASPQRQVKTLLLISALILCGLAMMIFWLHNEHTGSNVQENAFSEAPKEHEAKQLSPPISNDTLLASRPVPKTIVRPDSLMLEAAAIESVWVHIVIDGSLTKEYVLVPSYRIRWKAKNTFLLSVGNSSAMVLTLNGKRLGPIGKNKKPAKNFSISWETYDQLQKEVVKKDKG